MMTELSVTEEPRRHGQSGGGQNLIETVGAAMLNKQPHLLPLAVDPFDLAEI